MTATHDVIIVGAGPAGATAGSILAARGADVLIVDKAVFPREKLCAGLLTWKTVDTLERVYGESPQDLMDLGVINAAASHYRVRYRDRILLEGDCFYPFHFTRRRDFDAHLLDRAKQAGAAVRQGCQVRFVDPERGLVRLADGEELCGRYVIGCDGVASVTRRCCHFDGATWRRGLGGALEIALSRTDPLLAAKTHPDLQADFPIVYAGFLRAGYGWVFPHKDRLVIGIGGHSLVHSHDFIPKFKEFLTFLGLPSALAATARGYGLPYGNYLDHPWRGRTFLAGDAAGLVETLFGEGIYYALHSGELLAEAIHAALTREAVPEQLYEQGLKRDILPELIWSRYLRRLLYVCQGLGCRPLQWFMRGGGRRLAEMVHGVRSYRLLRRRAVGP